MQEVQEQQPAARRSRSDKGLPRRRSLLLSRAASARFVRVAAQLKGGEEELAYLLEPYIDQLFAGELHDRVVTEDTGDALFRPVGALEDLALAGVAKRMKGEASDG